MSAEHLERINSARIDWSTLWDRQVASEDWLIGPLVARGRGHALWAPAKAGKSLLALHVAACAAVGREVLDQPAGPPVRTLYVDHEMTADDVRERLTDMAFGPDDDLEPLAYLALPDVAVLDSAQGGRELLDVALDHRADLVVIDTFGRAVAGKENDADTTRAYWRHTGSPLKAAGIASLRLDHAGKDLDRGSRGSSAKTEDVDVVWKLAPRDRGRLDLHATHRRMAWVPEVVHLDRTEDPLAFTIATDSWPAGTKDAADLLDRLEVPLDAGRSRARDAIRAAGERMGNDALAGGLRWRRLQRKAHE